MKTKNLIIVLFVFILCINFSFGALTDDIKAYYKFDNDTSIIDSTGNGNNGTNNGATYSGSGLINGAYSFTTNDYIDIGDVSDTQNFSISGWFNADSFAGNNYIIDNQGSTSGYLIRLQSGTLYFYVGDGSDFININNGFVLNTSQWYNFVVQYNDDNNTMQLFLDGVLVASDTQQTLQQVSQNILIGSLDGSSSFFNGDLDELSFWDRPLSQTEITELYNSGTGLQYPFNGTPSTLADILVSIKNITANDVLFANNTNFTTDDITFNVTYQVNNSYLGSAYDNLVAYYTFDDNTSTDFTGNGNDGTDNGNTYSSGYDSQGAVFDGVNDYIEHTGFNMNDDYNFSLSLWFKTNSSNFTDSPQIFNNYKNGKRFGLLIRNNGIISAGIYNGTDYIEVASTGSSFVNTDTWYNVIITRNYTDFKLYVNNIEYSGVTSPYTSTSNYIGQRSSNGFFNGTIDEVMIFNTSLNQTQITELYNLSQKRFTDSSTTELTNQPNGNYNIQFEVDYNGTTDTSINYSYSVNVTNPLSNITYQDTDGNSTGFNVSSVLDFIKVESSLSSSYIPRITITNPLGTEVVDDLNMTFMDGTTWNYTSDTDLDLEGTWTIRVNVTDEDSDEWNLSTTLSVEVNYDLVNLTINGKESINETLAKNTTVEYVLLVNIPQNYDITYNISAEYNSSLLNIEFENTEYNLTRNDLLTEQFTGCAVPWYPPDWEGEKEITVCDNYTVSPDGNYINIYPRIKFNLTTNNTLTSGHLINITLTREYDGAQYNFTFNLSIENNRSVLTISSTDLWIDSTLSTTILSKDFILLSEQRDSYNCSFSTGNSSLDSILTISLGDGDNLFNLTRDTPTNITVYLPLIPTGLYRGYLGYSCSNATLGGEEVTLTQFVNYIIYSSSGVPEVVTGGGGGGGGGGGTTYVDLEDEGKVVCNIGISETEIYLNDNKLKQSIVLTNNEDFGFDPEMSFEYVSGDEVLIDRLRPTNIIDFIDTDSDAVTGVRLSTPVPQGTAIGKVIISSSKCLDIEIPIQINIDEESTLTADLSDLLSPEITLSEKIEDLSDRHIYVDSPITSVLGVTLLSFIIFGIIFMIPSTAKQKTSYREGSGKYIISNLFVTLILTAIAFILSIVWHSYIIGG